jgi:hypothetical protein
VQVEKLIRGNYEQRAVGAPGPISLAQDVNTLIAEGWGVIPGTVVSSENGMFCVMQRGNPDHIKVSTWPMTENNRDAFTVLPDGKVEIDITRIES